MTRLETESREACEKGLTRLNEASGNLYTLKKRVAYLVPLLNMLLLKLKDMIFKNLNLMLPS